MRKGSVRPPAASGAEPATAAGPDRVSSGLECTPGISLLRS